MLEKKLNQRKLSQSSVPPPIKHDIVISWHYLTKIWHHMTVLRGPFMPTSMRYQETQKEQEKTAQIMF